MPGVVPDVERHNVDLPSPPALSSRTRTRACGGSSACVRADPGADGLADVLSLDEGDLVPHASRLRDGFERVAEALQRSGAAQ